MFWCLFQARFHPYHIDLAREHVIPSDAQTAVVIQADPTLENPSLHSG